MRWILAMGFLAVMATGCGTRPETSCLTLRVDSDARELAHASFLGPEGAIGHLDFCGAEVQVSDGRRLMVWWNNVDKNAHLFRKGNVLVVDAIGPTKPSTKADTLGWDGQAVHIDDVTGLRPQ